MEDMGGEGESKVESSMANWWNLGSEIKSDLRPKL